MPLHPLGITRSRDVPPLVDVFADVCWSRGGDLACAFIDAPHEGFKPVRHALALEAIHRRTCVLPMRFGVTVRDETEIHALLQTRRSEWLDRLDQLDGACEIGLRIALPSRPTPLERIPSPLAYLEQRRSHYRHVDSGAELEQRVTERLLARFEGAYRDWRKLPATAAHRIRLAFLVERNHAAAFMGGAAESSVSERGGRCTVLGPWPPYSFV